MKTNLLVLAIALFALAPMASAAPITLTAGGPGVAVNYFGTQDPGSPCPACTNTSASVVFELLAEGVLHMTITNTGTDGLLTGVAFDSLPNLSDGSAPDIVAADFSPSLSSWQFAAGNGAGLGVGGYEIRMGHGGAGLASGQGGWFEGTLDATVASLQIDPTIVHIQSVQAFGGNSLKPQGCLSSDPECTATVPEPASLLLLGTGLLGMGMLGRRKR